MGLLNDIIAQNRQNIFDKEIIWKENHNLTINSIEIVDGKFGKQWKIEAIDTTSDNEEGYIYFSDKGISRNKILDALSAHIKESGPYEGVSLSGKVMEEAKGPLKPAVIAYQLREWAESYE